MRRTTQMDDIELEWDEMEMEMGEWAIDLVLVYRYPTMMMMIVVRFVDAWNLNSDYANQMNNEKETKTIYCTCILCCVPADPNDAIISEHCVLLLVWLR